ncbi:MAG: NAD-dependent epimerase/dehydratase family protein [Burkholderiaceae bacterium]|nr:NAD-dependent epimerase/dehydratase family protein [Burkholderiaceae bacterium]
MRCCVIGGGGFIGRNLCAALAASGREVVAIGRKAEPSSGFAGLPSFVNGSVRYLSMDVNDIPALRTVLASSDEVIDLAYATVPQTSFIDPMNDLQSNLPRVVALMEELKNHPQLRRFIVVSSGGTVYGQASRLPISEYSETEPLSPYGITKLTIERYALMYHRLHGLPVVVVRPANAYGQGQQPFLGQGFIATAMGNILQGKNVSVFGERGTVRDYVHVRDVASAMVAALQHGINGDVYNIGSGVGRSNLEVIDLIRPLAQQLNLPVNVSHEPERKFDVTANVLNFGRLLSCTGWLPKISIEEGLQEMWQGFTALSDGPKKNVSQPRND